MMLIDSEQRIRATNPLASFIVQAPAGSGKTEILTQRYLRLLSKVSAPEQIIALTFTRKAASEMRERIVVALQDAQAQKTPNSAHQQMTLDFAKEALQHSMKLQWDILLQPNRLKIITIDALCQSINHAIPMMEHHLSYANITEKPNTHYLNAGRRCIQFALDTPQYQEAIKTLLIHVDNRQDKLLELFRGLLSQRDQWLSPLFQAKAQHKHTFEEALYAIEQHELNRLKRSLPLLLASELVTLGRQLAVIENDLNSPRYKLKDWQHIDEIDKELAAALSKLLLTGEHNFRVSFDHHVGLKRGVCADDEYDRLKAASKNLLELLKDQPDFLAALIQVSQLPNPQYDPQQWMVLQALFVILPLLVSHLHLLFAEHNEVDFAAISQQALAALGDSDAPTDLALYLDNSIHHLLIDEFQDTSITQFELLNRLVQGWQNGDGKTLFVVGDPMQSIYRFRQAEVGLFFRAKKEGIGPIALEALELSCNFRSTKTIINWVNQHFATLFPKEFDIESGAVSFHASVNVIDSDEHSHIKALQFKNKQHEAEALIQLISQELNSDPNKTLAILVRSRTQLHDIIRLLRQHKIPYQGTDIDLLSHLLHLKDVWSLTQALLSPANRLSWLALLRSPYCALTLDDVHKIAVFNKKNSIYQTLKQLDRIEGLSAEGRTRADFFIRVMHQALLNRYQCSLSDWVSQTLKELHRDDILNQNQLADLEQFWGLLDRYEHKGRLPDIKEFQIELNKLYSAQATPSRLQVMTIHKSKGLEFDTVFLPGLGAQPNRGDNPMLRWLKLPTKNNGSMLLVSPIQAADQEGCELYDYLGQIDTEKSNYEAQRVLYVAVTRAKSRLYLLDSSSKSSKASFHSMLPSQEFEVQAHEEVNEATETPPPRLLKLPLEYYLEKLPPVFQTLNPPTKQLVIEIPRLTGIIMHHMLEWICTNHPKDAQEIPWNLVLHHCNKMGFDNPTQDRVLTTIRNQIIQLFGDPIGAWIITPHENEMNEYELLVEHQNKTATRVIDRCFEYKNQFWIIDFKTGKEDPLTLTKHQLQLNDYSYFLSAETHLPIQCGIYYLPTNHWVSWNYIPATKEYMELVHS